MQSALAVFRKFKWFTLFLVILSPIYPSLAAIGETNQYGVVSVDDSSIIASFTDDQSLDYIGENGMVTVDPDAHSGSEDPETPVEEPHDPNVKIYTVVEYDDIIKISKKYNVAAEVILWSNNLSMDDTLLVGQKLRIPQMNGIVVVLQPRQTVSDIAKQYNVSVDDILSMNNITDSRKIKDGTKLMIPGAVRPEPAPEPSKPTEAPKVTQLSSRVATSAAAKPATQSVKKAAEPKVSAAASAVSASSDARYPIRFTGNGRGFVPGNCTWHVARNKNVTWRGNANQWIRNARAQGVPTGKTPAVGAIVQFSGYGYSPQYGHVGIVTDIVDGNIIVSDMNYSGLYQITIRKVAIDHPAIDGYIYAN